MNLSAIKLLKDFWVYQKNVMVILYIQNLLIISNCKNSLGNQTRRDYIIEG